MRIEVTARGSNDLPFYTDCASHPFQAGVSLQYIWPGDSIEVKVTEDDGTPLGEWHAQNVLTADFVTVSRDKNGDIVLTDNGGNTYCRKIKNVS